MEEEEENTDMRIGWHRIQPETESEEIREKSKAEGGALVWRSNKEIRKGTCKHLDLHLRSN